MKLYACLIQPIGGEGLAVVAAESPEEARAEFTRRYELDLEGDLEGAGKFINPDGNEVLITYSFINPDNIKHVWYLGPAPIGQQPGLIAFGGSVE